LRAKRGNLIGKSLSISLYKREKPVSPLFLPLAFLVIASEAWQSQHPSTEIAMSLPLLAMTKDEGAAIG
jgi:hypothetical protein